MQTKQLIGVGLAILLALTGCASSSARTVSPTPSARIALAEDLVLREIGTGAYVVTHSYPWPANSLLVEMPDRTVVMAGTPYTAEAARLVIAWAEKQLGAQKFVAIDTGYHPDNLGGNQAFLEAGFPVYGSDLTVRLLQERGESIRALMLNLIGDPASPYYAAYRQMTFVPPDHVFPIQAGISLRYGNETVQVIYPGPSQAPDKVVVYFPERKLLFGSCMILGGDQIGNTADANLAAWPAAVESLEKYPVVVVVPGHGERLDPGLIQHTLDVLAAAP
ncbi:MAG TPA: MBL fold metallo-hydrolase [Anaerolineales bacterium]|nr:MBL fold metallo-hydrolase [Anaerolineales bacterium]